jgi:hypothetical protein
LLAQVIEGKVYLALDLSIGVARQEDASGLGDPFEAGSNIDAIAEQIVVLDHHIPEVDADAEFNALLDREIGVAQWYLSLHLNSASHCVHDARELDQDSIAHGLYDAAMMGRDCRFDEFSPENLQARDCAFFVQSDQTAVSHHIGRKDRGKPALDTLFLHRLLPAYWWSAVTLSPDVG